MPLAVLNVRPSRLKSLHLVRTDNRNKDLALQCIGERVLLYAPADEPRRGYFGTARIADVNPDLTQRRFIFVALEEVSLLNRFVALEELAAPIESRAYRADGSLDFSYFSMSIRGLTLDDQRAAHALLTRTEASTGFGESAQAELSVHPASFGSRGRRLREEGARNTRLRWSVLEVYGAACAVCGDDDAVHELGAYEVEVCHLRPLRQAGPDELTNAMPMCRKHHWAYDWGLFTLAEVGQIIPSIRMPPSLHKRFNGQTRARFPSTRQAWPKAEHLRFHREKVFLG